MRRERKRLDIKWPDGQWGECPKCGPVEKQETKPTGEHFRECLKCGSTLDWFREDLISNTPQPTRICQNCGKEREDYQKELDGQQQPGCKVCDACGLEARRFFANPPIQPHNRISDADFAAMIKRGTEG